MKGGSPLTPWLSRLLCNVGLVNSGEELVPVARNHPWIARFLLSLASLIQSHGHRCFPFLLLVLSAGPHNMETRKQRLCLGVSPGGLSWGSSSYDSVLPLQGAWVPSLVGELRSHMLRSTAKKLRGKKKSTDSGIG